MTKSLRASTIIPPDLYVHREADRQLRTVLEDMGRPAYVLVARQMGKTNLLLNARRDLETPSDAFLYIDLSNPLATARDCFQLIADTALTSHAAQFGALTTTLATLREKALPPHKEHELELRALLAAIPGKLVIILDEIDALTTSQYSDHIFSQIRSTYFSRVNIPEYQRLTYVLSGVAEPVDLIKNPKLSPFNIGEKIYLDDFSDTEAATLLANAKVALRQDTVARIYYWCAGNPRMTWDISAAAEDLALQGTAVAPADIDAIVKRLYLTSFDRAPVDHIRTLVESTSELRNAIVEMRFGKGSAISDAVRTKLYLAGILSLRAGTVVKNRIIEEALSDAWLRDVEKRKLGLLGVASQHVLRERYREARDVYQEFLGQGNPTGEALSTAYFGLAEAQFCLGEYEAALATVGKVPGDKATNPGIYYFRLYREGTCLYRLKRYPESIERYRELSEWQGDPKTRLRALANLISCYVSLGARERRKEIEEAFAAVMADVDAIDAFSASAKKRLKIVVYYNMARMHSLFGEAEAASGRLRDALAIAEGGERPLLLYEMALVAPELAAKQDLLRRGVDMIVSEGIQPGDLVRDGELALTGVEFGEMLGLAFEIDEEASFEKLFVYCYESDAARAPDARMPLGNEFLLSSKAAEKPEALRRVAARMMAAADTAGDHLAAFLSARVLAARSVGQPDQRTHAEKYLELLDRQSPTRALESLDATVIGRALVGAINQNDVERADQILSVVEKFRSSMTPGIGVLIDYYSMLVADQAGRTDKKVSLASSILTRVDALPVSALALRPRDVETIKRQAAAVFQASVEQTPYVRALPKIGRNAVVTVRYADGHTVTAKFKRLETDLQAGKCTLVT